MTKTYTITTNDTTITYTVRTCTAVAVSIGETERVDALYVDYYAESGEHVEYVVFNATMPEDEDEFIALCDYPDECRQLCEMADMADEWGNADGETFEGAICRAADKLHVRIW